MKGNEEGKGVKRREMEVEDGDGMGVERGYTMGKQPGEACCAVPCCVFTLPLPFA